MVIGSWGSTFTESYQQFGRIAPLSAFLSTHPTVLEIRLVYDSEFSQKVFFKYAWSFVTELYC